MSKTNIIRAWKDEAYRMGLSEDERAMVPDHPSGVVQVPDSSLEDIVGARSEHGLTLGCCPGFTSDGGFCSLFCPRVGPTYTDFCTYGFECK